MNPTSFFLLTFLLVLVTETAARGPREKFSQSAEDPSSNKVGLKIRASSSGSGSSFEEYSRSEDSWTKSKRPGSVSSESVHEESSSEVSSSSNSFGLKMKTAQGGDGMSSFKTKSKIRISKK